MCLTLLSFCQRVCIPCNLTIQLKAKNPTQCQSICTCHVSRKYRSSCVRKCLLSKSGFCKKTEVKLYMSFPLKISSHALISQNAVPWKKKSTTKIIEWVLGGRSLTPIFPGSPEDFKRMFLLRKVKKHKGKSRFKQIKSFYQNSCVYEGLSRVYGKTTKKTNTFFEKVLQEI